MQIENSMNQEMIQNQNLNQKQNQRIKNTDSQYSVATLSDFLKLFTTSHGIIVGKTGSGKTTFAKNIFNHLKNRKDIRILFYDTQFTFEKEHEPLRNLALHSIILAPDFHNQNDLLELGKKLFNIKLKFPKYRQLPIILLIDEIHSFMNRYSIPQELLFIITRGRGLRLFLCGITQRFSLVNKTYLTQLSYIVMFELNDFEKKSLQDNYIPYPFTFKKFQPYLYDFNQLRELKI